VLAERAPVVEPFQRELKGNLALAEPAPPLGHRRDAQEVIAGLRFTPSGLPVQAERRPVEAAASPPAS